VNSIVEFENQSKHLKAFFGLLIFFLFWGDNFISDSSNNNNNFIHLCFLKKTLFIFVKKNTINFIHLLALFV